MYSPAPQIHARTDLLAGSRWRGAPYLDATFAPSSYAGHRGEWRRALETNKLESEWQRMTMLRADEDGTYHYC